MMLPAKHCHPKATGVKRKLSLNICDLQVRHLNHSVLCLLLCSWRTEHMRWLEKIIPWCI